MKLSNPIDAEWLVSSAEEELANAGRPTAHCPAARSLSHRCS